MKKINLSEVSLFATSLFATPLLRITFLSGLMLLLLIGGTLAGITAAGGAVSREMERESAFHRLLREYDFKSTQILEASSDTMWRRELGRLDSDLNRLEKQAEGVESWLSVLKRRRHLAKLDSRYGQMYRETSQRAARAFPYSEPIIAVAAAALVHNTAITKEGEEYLRNNAPLLSSPRFAPMRLGIHVLLGDFNNPEKAAAGLPHDFTMPEYAAALTPETEIIFSNLTLLKILAGDIPSAAIDIQTALNVFYSPALIRLAAEFFYDFGNLLRSAELFSMLTDEAALSRQADALWLAGYTDNARAIWAMQVRQDRPLYNLALTAQTPEEEAYLLERLAERPHSEGRSVNDDLSRRFGLIRYSRLFEAPGAIKALDAERAATVGIASSVEALIDLEILKRRTEIGELSRMIAETWLLLDRYPNSANLCEWGAWYFNLQRNYTESAKLLQIASRHQFSGDWLNIYRALHQIREGYLGAAEELLVEVIAESGHWAAAANLGRIFETYRAPARALEHYEMAIADLMGSDRFTASRIQVRIAFCLRSLGRIEESRRALQYALTLNPDNLTARLELSRLE